MRAAIYFAPDPRTPLARLAAAWLGRDAFAGSATRPPDPALDPLVAEPARYGFHATLKAPFRLADGTTADALDAALARFAATRRAPRIARLALRRIDGFFALVPLDATPALDELAADTVRGFEPFRAPLSEGEIARRRPEQLTERQRRYLGEVGYPFVFEEFRFHMTLTGRITGDEANRVGDALARRFAPVIDRPLEVDALALFVERERGGPFAVRSHHPLHRSSPGEPPA